jgi:hypothetical protein
MLDFMHNGVCYNKSRMANEVDNNKMKQAEGREAAHAGLVILARLVARCHLERVRGFETGHDAEETEDSIEGEGDG